MPNFSKIFLQGNAAFSRSNQERQQSRLSSILDLQIKDFEIKEFFLIKSKNSLDKDKICEILNAQDLDLIPTFLLVLELALFHHGHQKRKKYLQYVAKLIFL